MIHPQAYIEEGAVIGRNVTIEPFAIVKKNVTLGDNVVIRSHAYVDGQTTIGEGAQIFQGVVIGTPPQSSRYKGESSFIRIGKRCVLREYCTVHASVEEGSVVTIEDDCMLMAYTHVAHNCTVGKGVIMANNATLAGHVTVGDYAIIGGFTPIHQFCHIGAYAMVGGMSRVNQDVPPFTLGGDIPYRMGGLNLVGLKRKGFSLETRLALAEAFRLVYRCMLPLDEALKQIECNLPKLPEVAQWVDFCKNSKRGLIGLHTIYKKRSQEEHQEQTV